MDADFHEKHAVPRGRSLHRPSVSRPLHRQERTGNHRADPGAPGDRNGLHPDEGTQRRPGLKSQSIDVVVVRRALMLPVCQVAPAFSIGLQNSSISGDAWQQRTMLGHRTVCRHQL